MAIESLSALPSGSDVFIDANIFVYGFNRQSHQCRDLLQRCAREDVLGVTSLEVLSEATHQLMLAEAVSANQIQRPDWRLLRKNPSIVKQLRQYWNQIKTILNLNLIFLSSGTSELHRSQLVRESYGLLTADSLIVATMEECGLECLASKDNDFGSIPTITVYQPTDGP